MLDKDIAPAVPDQAGAGADARRDLIQRILASRSFAKSPRLRSFLAFVAEESLSGRSGAVTELEVGRRIFGRGNGFVPAEDSVVRVSARQLRVKLKEYFEGEGQHEILLVDIPKGSYVPVFVERLTAAVEIPSVLSTTGRRWSWLLAGSLALNAALLAAVWWSGRLPRGETWNTKSLLEAVLFADRTPVRVVLPDYSLSLMRIGTSSLPYGLKEYAAWDYESLRPGGGEGPRFRSLFEILRTRRITRLGDLTTVLSIQRAAAGRAEVQVRHSRDISIRDFKTGRHILLGNPHSTPWIDLFEERLNFRSVRGLAAVGFVNRQPRPGEAAQYAVPGPDAGNANGVGYARVSLVPNTSDKEAVLIVGGVNMVTMEAAGEFIADAKAVPEFLRALNLRSLEKLPYFELILETHAVDNTPQQARIVASRILAR